MEMSGEKKNVVWKWRIHNPARASFCRCSWFCANESLLHFTEYLDWIQILLLLTIA